MEIKRDIIFTPCQWWEMTDDKKLFRFGFKTLWKRRERSEVRTNYIKLEKWLFSIDEWIVRPDNEKIFNVRRIQGFSRIFCNRNFAKNCFVHPIRFMKYLCLQISQKFFLRMLKRSLFEIYRIWGNETEKWTKSFFLILYPQLEGSGLKPCHLKKITGSLVLFLKPVSEKKLWNLPYEYFVK